MIQKSKRFIKFLGVIIDDKLTWNSHIDHIVSKMCSGVYSIKALNILRDYILRTIHVTNVETHLLYGLGAWGSLTRKKQLKTIIQKQEQCLRNMGWYRKN